MKKEFIVERNGRSFVLYAGLLDLAHERGLKAVTTTLVQIPSDLNGGVAIVHATVETSQGTFTGLGDAAADNVSRMMVPHLIRMAETRAKARALRDAVNVGVTALEELGDIDEPAPYEPAEREPVAAGRSNGRPDASANGHAARGEQSAEERGASRGLRALEPRDLEPAAGNSGPRPGAAPATPKQLQTIQRMARAAGKTIAAENLTRAQASEIISNLIGEMDQRAAG
ncbi:MAG TPA: hypothetical protein VFX49_08890 [Chloroflexota bacterium]|nr:hypothetical protein [Chloroflexota bacterium]